MSVDASPRATGFLDRIVADRLEDIAKAKETTPIGELHQALPLAPAVRDLVASLRRPGISLIGEIKRTSPAKGVLAATADPARLAVSYAGNGARAISVLTEERHFHGSLDDLRAVRAALERAGLSTPILRKDFVLDPYQIVESRVAGADAVLVIVKIVDEAMLRLLIRESFRCGLTAFVEVNNEDEVRRAVAAGARLIGINNRDLHSFVVDLATTGRLRPLIPAGVTVASLSGIATRADVECLREWQVDAMLIGEALMVSGEPGIRAGELVRWGQGK